MRCLSWPGRCRAPTDQSRRRGPVAGPEHRRGHGALYDGLNGAGRAEPPGGHEAVRAAIDQHLRHVARAVWHPSVVLKELGLYHPVQAGVRPPPPDRAGRGERFSRLHPTPVLLDEDVVGCQRAPRAADQTGCVLATHARVVFDEMLRVVEPYLVPSTRLLHGGTGNHTEVLDLAVAVPEG